MTTYELQMEKFQLAQERDDVMDQQSSRYEERLVELHSVIAELSKQCEAKGARDVEEDEEERGGDDASTPIYADVVVVEEEDDKKEAADTRSRTSTDVLDAEAVEAGERFIAGSSDLCSFLKLSRSMSRY